MRQRCTAVGCNNMAGHSTPASVGGALCWKHGRQLEAAVKDVVNRWVEEQNSRPEEFGEYFTGVKEMDSREEGGVEWEE